MKELNDHELARAWLESRMRDMWHRLEQIGVVTLIDGEIIVPLRHPSMTEFRMAAEAVGVPQPRSWAQFYEVTFGPLPEERIQ